MRRRLRRKGPEVVRELIRDHDALVLDRHGAVTVGYSAMDAFSKLAKVENTAHVVLVAHLLGHIKELPSDEVQTLLAKRREHAQAGELRGRALADEELAGSNATPPAKAGDAERDRLKAIVQEVTEEVLRRLGHS